MARTFLGGVHPTGQKQLARDAAVTPLRKTPQQVVLPMSMHIGAPCTPIVEVGAHVRIGDKIAETNGLGAPIHASISGTVTHVENRIDVSGKKTLSVVIEHDGKQERKPTHAVEQMDALTNEQMIEIIKEAGITGLGGAGFPTHVKLSSAIGKVDTLLVNSAECEPYITSDDRLMLEFHEEMILGLRLVMKLLGVKSAHIGVEANKKDALEILEEKYPPKSSDIHIHSLKTRYPQGAEKQLIAVITGREVPPGGLPSDVGCVVLNAATIYAIYEAFYLGKPLTERIVTLTGKGVKEPRNVWVPLGTPMEHLIEEAGGLTEQAVRIVAGGPMMGAAQTSPEAGTIKGTNCVLVLDESECKPLDQQEGPCIRCARCVMACPMRLEPLTLHQYGKKNDLDAAEKYNVVDCFECSACSFVCPAKISLKESIAATKAKVLRRQEFQRKRKGAAAK